MFKIKCECGNEANVTLNGKTINFNNISRYENEAPFQIWQDEDGCLSIKCNSCNKEILEGY